MRVSYYLSLTAFLVAALGMGSAAKAQYAGHMSSLVMDARTGQVLSSSDADLQRYPASLTKMMTLYITFRTVAEGRMSLEDTMPVSIHCSMQEPSKLGMRPGSTLKVESAILGLVTKSANDAACTLGEYMGGGDEASFAAEMTRTAHQIGMSSTTFRNASGLPDPDQVTTARDMAVLARHIMKDFPQYYHYFNVRSFYFNRRTIPNHDPLLGIYAGADGLKTGYTALAGHNLVSSAWQGDIRLIGVVLGARSNGIRNGEMIALLDKGFVAEGHTPLPLIKRAAPSRALIAKRGKRSGIRSIHQRQDVRLVSYRPYRKAGTAASGMVHKTRVSKRGHHRS
ncbi:D-alanyl-D-alanine carboxypeptidase [Acetobacteraceae bacterium ESL0709]|nr:D-alanyl-D-alanine carboxypeptidase [Acetobacteraceae bacterium ESL0697]MDF7677276.1 D-alanyl-D-alanine carboxypeptidase [Acetobacteraceae bacterium ESL0709]